MSPKPEKAASTVREVLMRKFYYDPEAGYFTNRKTGELAEQVLVHNGEPKKLRFTVAGATYYAHRLAWLYMCGDWPKHHIDHIDGNPFNNAFSNLRDVTSRQNNCNYARHRNGYLPGATFCKGRRSPWWARVKVNGRDRSLGFFRTQEEAHARYKQEVAKL